MSSSYIKSLEYDLHLKDTKMWRVKRLLLKYFSMEIIKKVMESKKISILYLKYKIDLYGRKLDVIKSGYSEDQSEICNIILNSERYDIIDVNMLNVFFDLVFTHYEGWEVLDGQKEDDWEMV